jgi:hypothetical protein
MTGADFTRFLVERGLSAAGSAETMQELKARYGVRRWFGFSNVIDLPPASLFPEQTEPFFFQPHLIYLLPPNELECDFDYCRNGPRTHALALERLTALFGAPETIVTSNTLSQRWRFDRMSLRIQTFLKEKFTGRNPLYERHPELWNVCRISIDRNLVGALTQAEADTLQSLSPNQMLPVDPSLWRPIKDLLSWERGLFRLASESADATPFLWRQSADIGWCAGPWSAVFARRLSLTLQLLRMSPGKGAGYSELAVRLDNPFTLEPQVVATTVLKGKDTNSLDGVAPEVAAFWDLPLSVEESCNA